MTLYEPDNRLPEQVQRLLSRIGQALDAPEAAALERQFSSAKIVRGSPTMIDVEVPLGLQRLALPDGPLPVTAIVRDKSNNDSGEVLVWIKSGVLIGVEQAWYTDSPPSDWPSAERVFVS